MARELFVKQLDGCTYCSGGLNCNCACHASWLYRASGGRIRRTACSVRTQTGDRSGGTNLRQMQTVATQAGLPGVLWQPGRFSKLRELVLTGRYGADLSIGYRGLANTSHDCFDGGFTGAHGLYLSTGTADDARYADPGADGRRPSIPSGFQNIDWAWLERLAGSLPLVAGGPTLAQEYGSGYVYALLTPADPVTTAQRWRVTISGAGARVVLYSAPNGLRYDKGVSLATYICTRALVAGLWWFQIKTTSTGGATGNAGKWFKPNRYVEAVKA